MPWLGGLEEIRGVLTSRSVDMVIIALPHAEYSRLTAVLHEIGDEPVAIHLVPDLFSLASLRGGVEEFESVPFIHLRESPLYGWNRVLKRGFDLVLGALALLVALPFMAAIAVAIRLDLGAAGALPPGADGAGRSAVPDAEVPHDAAGRRGRHRAARGRRPTIPGARSSAPSCAAPAWTSCPSWSTCCAAR